MGELTAQKTAHVLKKMWINENYGAPLFLSGALFPCRKRGEDKKGCLCDTKRELSLCRARRARHKGGFIFLINNCAFENRNFDNFSNKAKRRFCLVPSICRYLGLRKGGEAAALNNMCALKDAAAEGKAVRVSPQLTAIRRQQLAEDCVNLPFILQFCYKIRGKIIQAGVILKAQSSKE